MASLFAYFVYMFAAAVWSSFANFHLFCLAMIQPHTTHQRIDVALAYQSGSAVVQLALLVLLCPRTLYVDGYFVVSLHGPARTFDSSTAIVCFAVLVGLATYNVIPTAVSFIHRLLIKLNKKIPTWGLGVLLIFLMWPYVKITKNLIFTEEWSTRSRSTFSHESIYNRTTEDTKLIGYSTTTPEGNYVIGVVVLSPLLVLFFAVLVNLAAHHLLLRLQSTELTRKMHRALVQEFIIQAIIPVVTTFNVLLWLFGQKIIHLFPYVEYVVFGVGPFILYVQAFLSYRSMSRLQRECRWEYRVAISVFYSILFMVFAGVCVVMMCVDSSKVQAEDLRKHGRFYPSRNGLPYHFPIFS